MTAFAFLVAATAVTAALAMGDRATAADRADLADLSFGRPVAWLQQDFTSVDPPSFPRTYSPGDPHDMPTTIEPGPFVLTVAGIVLVELVVLAPGYWWLRRRRAS